MAKVSDAGVSFIKAHEGLSLDAYPDGQGWSIGYGHHGNDVYYGLTITEALADQLLKSDLEKFENAVEGMLDLPATQEEFDALVSYAYNCGVGALRQSQLLAYVNAGRHADAVEEWTRGWDDALPGLQKRREKEAELYRKGGRAG